MRWYRPFGDWPWWDAAEATSSLPGDDLLPGAAPDFTAPTGAAGAGADPAAGAGSATTPAAGASGGVHGVAQALTGSQQIDALFSLAKWNSLALTYSFPNAGTVYPNNYPSGENTDVHFAQANPAIETAVTWALTNQYSVVTPLTFTRAADTSTANISVAMSDISPTTTAYAYYPSAAANGGDVWVQYNGQYINPVRGNLGWLGMIHELGHSMGLKHPFQASNGNSTIADPSWDAMEFTVMTYRSFNNAPADFYRNETFGYAQSLMMDDIAALQTMYGAKFGGGPTTYSFDPSTGEESINGVGQGAPGANRVFLTIWDGSGQATYDFSAYTTNAKIDLTPGGWSTLSAVQLARLGTDASSVVHYADGNVFNALQYNGDVRSLVANVLVGSGNDSVKGNAANNTVTLGSGQDTVDGGVGRDTVVFNETHAQASITNNHDGSWTVTGPAGTDTLKSVEVAHFSDGNVVLHVIPHGDFNGDDSADILFRNAVDGRAWLYTMQGNSITGGGLVGTVDNGWSVAGVGDFNGDGRADILWHNADGRVWLYTMDGAQVTGGGLVTQVSTDWQVAGTGDFNGDGTADILWRNADGRNYLYEMNGTQIIGGGGITTVDTSWSVAGVGDFNADGRADILWRNTAGDTWLYAMNGTEIIGGGFVANVPTNWSVAGVGDFNGDGRADILWRNTAGDVWMYEMNGNQVIGGGLVANVPTSWSVAAIGDFTNQGRDDILWRNSNGDTWLYVMNGTQIVGGGEVASVATDWHVIA